MTLSDLNVDPTMMQYNLCFTLPCTTRFKPVHKNCLNTSMVVFIFICRQLHKSKSVYACEREEQNEKSGKGRPCNPFSMFEIDEGAALTKVQVYINLTYIKTLCHGTEKFND